MTCFVAFGRQPRLPGDYLKEVFAFEMSSLWAYFKSKGGFWSLVRGDHATLVAMETLQTTVMNIEKFPPPTDSQHPRKPAIGDEVVVVIPEDSFVEWTDESISDIDFSKGLKVPMPVCRIERWIRIK